MELPQSAKAEPIKIIVPSALEDFGELLAGDAIQLPNSNRKISVPGLTSNEKATPSYNGSAQSKSIKVDSLKIIRTKELMSSSGSAYDGMQRNNDPPEENQTSGSGPRPFGFSNNSEVEDEIEDKLSVFASTNSASKPLIHYRFDTTYIQNDLLGSSAQGLPGTKQAENPLTLDSIVKYFTTKNLYFDCLHYELIGYYLAFVFSLMNVYLSISTSQKWSNALVPFLVIDIVMLLRFGNITKQPKIVPKITSLGLSILVYSCIIIFEFWRFAGLWFIALLPLANTVYRIGWNKVQYGPKLMFPYLLIRDVQIFFCALRLVFHWPSWTGALIFAFGTAVFDICILALFVFKVTFLVINSAAKKDLKILQNNRTFQI
jgi:hypothetical protein